MVIVSIVEFCKFYVFGEVRNFNGYVYEFGMIVEKFIVLVGGFIDCVDCKDINI